MQKEISELYNLVQNKNIEKAYSLTKKLYQNNKNNKDIVKILAYLHIQKSQFDAAMNVLENYYNDNSEEKDFDYFINMGVCLKASEEYEQSLKMYEEATKINPESHMCYTVPAEIYLKLRNFEKSMELLNISLDKINLDGKESINFPNTIKLKTEVFVALNKDKENENMLLKILNEKFHPDIFYLLSIVNAKLIDKEILSKAERQLKEYDQKYTNKLDRFWYVHPLYFGLAIYYSKKDQKNQKIFIYLGNKEIMGSLRYNSFDYQKDIGNIIECYNDKFKKINVENNYGENNFFILGTPRSGTTLIESMIASNKEVTSGGELLSARNLIADFVNDVNKENTSTFIDRFNETYIRRTDFFKRRI